MRRDIQQKYLFARLHELSAEDKNTVFAQACLFQPDHTDELELLRTRASENELLIDSTDESTGSISPPVVHALNLALQSFSTENPGTSIGSYLLVEIIGRGGFSTVWRAEQQKPVRREVALKIIKVGMDTRELIARFEAERQALAVMSHPNVAAVYDAGTADSGRPFFVMELVQGIPITEYCDKKRLSIRQRLNLFIDACRGVHHAHGKGLIHRDLKPSNILVTDTDKGPVPKIIDFGIAKAASKSLTNHTLHTELFRFMGTPVYSSPEHLLSGGVDVDAGSDVYNLGVTLYELLAGTLPYDLDTLNSKGFDEARKILLQSDPPRLNQRLRSLQVAELLAIAENRNTQPAALLRLLQGDIEWIVFKCLEKDRSRRYNSLADLIVDLENFLLDKPVGARPPSRWYLLNKTIMRHRVSAFWICSVVISVIIGTVLTITGYQSTVNERRIANNARMKTEELAKFLTEEVYWNQRDYGQSEALIDTLERTIKFLEQTPGGVHSPETIKAYAHALEKLAYEKTLPYPNSLHEEYTGILLSSLEKALDLRREVSRMVPDDVENSRGILKDEMDLALISGSRSTWDKKQIEIIRQFSANEKDLPAEMDSNERIMLGWMLIARGWAACRLLGKPEDGLSATKEGCAYFEKSLSDNPGDSLVMRAVLLAYAARDDALRGAVRNGIIGKKEGSKLATEYGWMALDLSSQAIELYPDNVSLYIAGTLAALIQLRTLNTYNGDRCDDAIAIGRKYFDKWILLDPKNISAVIQKSNVLMEIATVHLNAYQMEKARAVNLEALNNLRSTDSDDILEETYYAVFVQAGEIASKSGDWDKTAEYLDRLKKMNTTKYSDKEYELLDMRLRRFDRFFMASSLEEALGNWTEVEEQAKELISDSTEGLIKYPDTPFEWMPRRSIAEAQLGRALLRQGRFAESVKWLETALQDLYDSPPNWATAEDPDRLRSRMHRDLGEAFQSMEKWEEARNHYQIARRIHEEELEWCKPSIEFVVNSVDTLWKLASLPEETDDLSQPTAHRIELLRQARNLLENQDFKDREEPLPPEYSKLNAVINEEYQKLVTKEFVDAV